MGCLSLHTCSTSLQKSQEHITVVCMSTWRTAILPGLGLLFFFFLISHSQIMHCHPAVNTKHMRPLSSSWWQGNRLCTVWSSFLTGSSSRLQMYPGSEKKRNKTQSLKSLSRLWLIHICLALFLTNKMLRRSRINTTQGALGVFWVLKVHNSQTKANLTDQHCSAKIWFWRNVSAKMVVFGNIWE